MKYDIPSKKKYLCNERQEKKQEELQEKRWNWVWDEISTFLINPDEKNGHEGPNSRIYLELTTEIIFSFKATEKVDVNNTFLSMPTF